MNDAEIDAEHRELFRLATDLHLAMMAGQVRGNVISGNAFNGRVRR